MRISLSHTVVNIDNLKVVRIYTPEDFSLLCYRQFRAVYKNENDLGTKFILDFIHTASLSASAIGMILLLKDHVALIKGQLNFVNPVFTPTYELLKATGLEPMFTITFKDDVNKNKTKAMQRHGRYVISSDKQILTMKAYDEWNLETVISCCNTFKEEAKKLVHSSWSCIVDLSEWELGPPEMLDEIRKLNMWSEKNNQRLEAVITKNSLQQHLLENTHSVFERIQAKFFDNHDDAICWLSNA